MLLEDEVLAGMFAELAESVPVPAEGAAAALAAIRDGRTETAPVIDIEEVRARRRKRVGAVVGAAAAALIVLGVVAAHGGSSGGLATEPSGGLSAGSSTVSAGAPVPAAAGASAAAVAPGPQDLERGLTPASPAALPSATAAASRGGSGGSGTPDVDSDRVIRTGDVNLVVPRTTVPATVSKLEAVATDGLGGYLQDSQTQQADPKSGVATASVTLRVPAARFETLLSRVEALGTVQTSTTTGKDVTSQFVDLDARLTALKTSRETYLVILSKATTVNDTLAVQQRLDDLQQQIEQLQGQENQLGAQSDLATLTVEVSEPTPTPAPAPAAPKARSGLSAAWHTAGARFRRGTEAVIASLGTLALLLIAGLAALVAGRFGRRYYLRRTV